LYGCSSLGQARLHWFVVPTNTPGTHLGKQPEAAAVLILIDSYASLRTHILFLLGAMPLLPWGQLWL